MGEYFHLLLMSRTKLILFEHIAADGRVQMLELKNSNDTLKEELGRTKDLLKKAENSEATAQVRQASGHS